MPLIYFRKLQIGVSYKTRSNVDRRFDPKIWTGRWQLWIPGAMSYRNIKETTMASDASSEKGIKNYISFSHRKIYHSQLNRNCPAGIGNKYFFIYSTFAIVVKQWREKEKRTRNVALSIEESAVILEKVLRSYCCITYLNGVNKLQLTYLHARMNVCICMYEYVHIHTYIIISSRMGLCRWTRCFKINRRNVRFFLIIARIF